QCGACSVSDHFGVAPGGEFDSVRGAVRRVEFEPRRRIPSGDVWRAHSCAIGSEIEACNSDFPYCPLPDAEWKDVSDEWEFTDVEAVFVLFHLPFALQVADAYDILAVLVEPVSEQGILSPVLI